MKTALEWDEILTNSPMNEKEALESVRVKPCEIEAIQGDARSELLERIKTLESEPQSKPPDSKGIGMYELAKEHRERKQSLLPGLREAWRILNVAPEEDLAFKVGRLMERIKELEK